MLPAAGLPRQEPSVTAARAGRPGANAGTDATRRDLSRHVRVASVRACPTSRSIARAAASPSRTPPSAFAAGRDSMTATSPAGPVGGPRTRPHPASPSRGWPSSRPSCRSSPWPISMPSGSPSGAAWSRSSSSSRVGAFPVALVGAAVLVPVLVVLYVYSVDVYEDTPLPVLILTMAWGIAWGIIFAVAIDNLVPTGGRLGGARMGEMLTLGVIVPLAGAGGDGHRTAASSCATAATTTSSTGRRSASRRRSRSSAPRSSPGRWTCSRPA